MQHLQHNYFTTEDGELVISGYLSNNERISDTAIIWFVGALGAGDMGERTFPEKLLERNISVFYPDYYGVFRSGKTFSVENCARTVIDTIKAVTGGTLTKVGSDELIPHHTQYTNVLCVFSSFAGWIPWWLHQHWDEVAGIEHLNRIAWHCPLIDIDRQADAPFTKEESLREFLFHGTQVYHRTYRGITDKEWQDFFFVGGTHNRPVQAPECVSRLHTSIVHGENDSVIYPIKSVGFHSQISANGVGTHHLHLLPNEGHGGETMEHKALLHYLQDFSL